MAVPMLGRTALFEGLPAEALEELATLMRPRRFAAGDIVCRAGEAGDSLFLIVDGLARVTRDDPATSSRAVARLRRGDVIGEMALVTGEPRSATVVAAAPTSVLELRRDDFAAGIARYPRLLENLNRILSHRLAETTARVGERRTRGEAVAVLVDQVGGRALPALVEATEAASPRPVVSLDARISLENALAGLDEAVAAHGTVLVVAEIASDELPLLIDSVDRTIALVGSEAELRRLTGALERAGGDHAVEAIVLAGSTGELPSDRLLHSRVVREVALTDGDLAPADAAWIGRHLARTKLGLALGAGGAKGYAHIAVLRALEEEGYVVDCVAGSSIGAVIGTMLARGMKAAEIEGSLRHAFRPEVVSELFTLSMSGMSAGVETMASLAREATGDATFADLSVPLVVMTVDLVGRAPAPVTEGPLWEALVAATAIAGLFPPYESDSQRLVDGVALVPVPTEAVVAAGADVTLAVNIMSRDTLPAWPGETPLPPEPRGGRSRMLDTLLEVIDLSQVDASERHAALADVVVTPRFGPATWRDFHLADLFLEAGRAAAAEQMPKLRTLIRPAAQ